MHPAVLQTTAPPPSLYPRQPNFIHQATSTRMAKIAPTPTPTQTPTPTPTQCSPILTPPPPSRGHQKTPAQLTHPFIYFMFCLHCRLAQEQQQQKQQHGDMERKALGNPLWWRHRVRAIKREYKRSVIRKRWRSFRNRMNDSSEQLRKELAIWLLISSVLRWVEVSAKMAERVGNRKCQRELNRERASEGVCVCVCECIPMWQQRHRDSINKLTGWLAQTSLSSRIRF